MSADGSNENVRRELKATGWLAIGAVAWVATLALASLGPGSLWGSEQTVISWAAVGLNLVVGVAWIVVYIRYLRAVDELQRKIQLEALAATLGVGWIGGFSWVVADMVGLVESTESTLAIFSAGLGIVFVIAIAVGFIRYR